MSQVKLTVTGIEARRKKGQNKFYADGGCRCLYLRTTASETASWVFRWRDRNTRKLRDMGLGTVIEIPLAEAREIASDLRKTVRLGADPIQQRRTQREKALAVYAKSTTFDQCVDAYIAAKQSEWKNPKHRQQWENTLKQYASPIVGSIAVDLIELPHVIKVLEPIWITKTETATRLRGRIEQVLAWSTVSGYRTGDNPARWKGNLDQVLPKPSKVKKVIHHPALHWNDIHEFMINLRAKSGMGARALEFAILTASRSGEVRHAKWEEIDFDNKLWRIPAERMKGNKPHTVPLSNASINLLGSLPESSSAYIFAAPRGGALSDMSLSKVTRSMGLKVVPHGFRSTFKDWARSCTNYTDEVSELALAHINNDATRAAYARDELIPRRTKMMKEWARFIDLEPTQNANVTPIYNPA